MTLLDPNTPGYERWCEAARAVDAKRESLGVRYARMPTCST